MVVTSRLPVDRVESPDGGQEWQPSPGGLVGLGPVRDRSHALLRGLVTAIGRDAFCSDLLATVGLDDRKSSHGYLSHAEQLMPDAVGAEQAFYLTAASLLGEAPAPAGPQPVPGLRENPAVFA